MKKILYCLIFLLFPLIINSKSNLFSNVERLEMNPNDHKEIVVYLNDNNVNSGKFKIFTTSKYVDINNIVFNDKLEINQLEEYYYFKLKNNLKKDEFLIKFNITATNALINDYGNIIVNMLDVKDSKKNYVTSRNLSIYFKITDDQIKSSDSKLKYLDIDNVSINFEPLILEYNINASKLDKLNIVALANDEKANVKISNKYLKNKNTIINIIVTAQDGTKTIYKLNILKEDIVEKDVIINNNNKVVGYIVMLVSLIIILFNLIYLIIKQMS